jgi:hypothetical protein
VNQLPVAGVKDEDQIREEIERILGEARSKDESWA